MKLLHIVAAGGLLMGLSAPALAQMPPPGGDAGMHHNDPGSSGDMHTGPGMHGGPGGPDMRDGHDTGRGPGLGGGDIHDHAQTGGDHRGRRGGHHPRCRTVWRHHHRVRQCMR